MTHDIGTIIEALEQYTRGDDHQRAIDAAVEVLRAVESRESALIAERDALLLAGGYLANCAYNLAQCSGEVLSARSAVALDNARRKWDAVLSAPAVEGGGVMDTKRSGIQQQRLMPSSPASMQCATTGRSDGLNQDYSRGLHLWFASRLDARHTVRRWFGEQRKNMKTPTTPQGLPPYIYGWEVGPNEKVWSEAAVREALRAQAASVEPVGKIINSGGNTGSLPEHPLLVWLGGVPPVGTELYASAPPSPASAPVLVTSVMGLDVYVSPNGEPAQAVPDGWALARAQDTSDYSRETIPEQVEDSLHNKIMNLRCMPDHEIEQAHEHNSPRFAYKCGHRDARHAAAELAAPQASRQPQAQQGGVESEEAQNYRWLRAHGAANSKQGSTAFDGDALRLGFQFMYWCDPGKLDQLITQKRAALAAKDRS